MPPLIQGNNQQPQKLDFRSVDYKYKYPLGLRLKPGSKLHDALVKELLSRAQSSASMMTTRFSAWKKLDQTMTAYIEIDSDEKKVKNDDNRKPVSIVFPYSYVILETMLAYMSAVFLQPPFFRYEGVGSEDTIGAILLENVVNNGAIKSKVPLALHTMIRDSFVYGIGVGAPVWVVKRAKKVIKRRKKFFSRVLGMIKETGDFERATQEGVSYEGNALNNIDPYLLLPDPNVPIHEVQKGEYIGWIERSNLMRMRSEELNSDDCFNVEYLQHVKGAISTIYDKDSSGRASKTGMSPLGDSTGLTNPVDNIHMYVELIPSEWGLGAGKKPEKWTFRLSADAIITKAAPTNLNHNMFPVAVAAPDTDGYSSIPTSRLEILGGMQTTLDWLFNSHVANVRKSINDMFVVDPYSVNVNDIKNPSAGKLIRTRRPVWGKGVQNVMQQLAVSDVTRGHIADSTFIVQWMQKIGAADDAMMGSTRQGGPERIPGAEAAATQQGSANRMQRLAMLISYQAMQDIGYMFACHTQQLMSEDTFVKLTGDHMEKLKAEYGITDPKVKVSPFDLLIDFDTVVSDGSVPNSGFTPFWIEMFKFISADPALRAAFDVKRIFKHIARNLGAKNVDDFEIKVVPDEQIPGMVAGGQLTQVPQGGLGNVNGSVSGDDGAV